MLFNLEKLGGWKASRCEGGLPLKCAYEVAGCEVIT